MQNFITETDFWGTLHLLKPALEAELKRLQTNESGLNYIEQLLLDNHNRGIRTKPEVYLEFWKTEKIYGMGDAEIDIYLKGLQNKALIGDFN